MKPLKRRITFDFETRSAGELKKIGAYKYSLDPSTQPTCLAIKVHGHGKIFFLDFKSINSQWSSLPQEFRNIWQSFIVNRYEFSAHNAFFETAIYKNILVKRLGWPDIPFDRFRCTAAKAAACALPRNLAGAGEAMKLSTQKDKRGFIAMMLTCKPTKHWNAWNKLQIQVKNGGKISEKKRLKAREPEPPKFLEPQANPGVWNTLYEYCKIDVLAEEALDSALPDLNPTEQEIWFLNQKLNWRGLRVDIPTIKKIVNIMERESKLKLTELDKLTMGLVTKPGARASILKFLALDGIELPDIKAKTVEDALSGGAVSGDMKRLLEIRQALSKTSTKKYQAFLDRAVGDRVGDILLYHGAGPGRDSGTGIQPQNFPRGVIKTDKERPYLAVGNVIDCNEDMLHLLYGQSLGMLFSSILRNMLIPSEGHELFVADFAKIEVAVCWWLADNLPGLKVLNSGQDPYKYQAAHNTGKLYADIPDEGDERQLAKAQILGCQFGMGWAKFQSTAWDQYRLKLSDVQSKEAVKRYRETNSAVPALWVACEKAAVGAIENPGTIYKAGKCEFWVAKKFLWIELPSGRRLAYREPSLGWRETDYGPKKTIQFMGVNPKTKKWDRERSWGGVIVENIVQGTARELLKHGELRLERAGYKVLLTVHDEALCEREKGQGSVDEFRKILLHRPLWADRSLPLDAKAWAGPRYRK